MLIPLQIQQATTKLLDYGILGLALVFVGFFAWYLFKQQQRYAEGWREQSAKLSDSFVSISQKQNETNQRLIDIREKDVMQSKDYHEDIRRSVDAIPEKIIKELNYQKFQISQNPNLTSAP